jgi:hypothetical protein
MHRHRDAKNFTPRLFAPAPTRHEGPTDTNGASFCAVMPAHNRSKNGVASLAYGGGIHALLSQLHQRRGWPGHARP